MTSWNKFCFTGGLIEASVTLPGINNVVGLWPAIWTLGNLGEFFLHPCQPWHKYAGRTCGVWCKPRWHGKMGLSRDDASVELCTSVAVYI
jgi:hypothetical protein